MPFIELRGLRKEFGPTLAVAGLDLQIQEGEFICFLGPSGCGKTTTLRMIAGLEQPTRGEIYLAGQRVTDVPPQRRNIGFVFQTYALFWHASVYDNLAFGLRVRRLAELEIQRRVNEVARRLELEGLLGMRAARLDLSAMQRVALGRTLITQPRVLLLDEPLNNFRPGLREIMRGELKRLQKQLGTTMVYVTHDQEEAMTLGDRILVMNAGRMEQLGTPGEIYRRPSSLFVAEFIGRPPMNFFEAQWRWEGEQAVVTREKWRWDLPARAAGPAQAQPVLLGIRPEHILPAAEAERRGLRGARLEAWVDLVQPLARKSIVDLVVDGVALKMILPSSYPLRAGSRLAVAFDPDQVRLFDPSTGRALT